MLASRHLTYAALLALGFAVGVLAHTWWSADDEDVDDLSVVDEDAPAAAGECKMILGVRMDLKMDKGKIAAQCGHATLAVYKAAVKQRPDYVLAWQRRGQTKIAIKIPDEAHMAQLLADAKKAGIPAEVIQDAGRTQVAPGSRTVIGIGPGTSHLLIAAPIAQMDQLTRAFKLL
ncbi:aminoacyl-tRNA hydrolase [Malassezia caprae]|uniref:peptidyl-tRNA hydrolase n=1 Tax=Malassezia caprae TaxID=1381934 RepID=A0AAF0E6E8_9BASI|nr:aminoacyl-tRNA hydrolase [Malassezia caprae]